MKHWPEYLAEALGLGLFMVAAGVVATALDSPRSPLHAWIADADVRRILAGVAMGLTAIGLIYSPWGKRSGAHMNPAVTGGLVGVLLVAGLLGDAFAGTPVSFAATMPGGAGVAVAFAAEFVISFILLLTVLAVAGHPRHSQRAGLVAGVLVTLYICVEAPLSGMSMNPARSFASAAPGALWQNLWIYFVAPPLGMVLAARVYLARHRSRYAGCAKLVHDPAHRCIHCGHEPAHGSATP
jgi:aquaporin Z